MDSEMRFLSQRQRTLLLTAQQAAQASRSLGSSCPGMPWGIRGRSREMVPYSDFTSQLRKFNLGNFNKESKRKLSNLCFGGKHFLQYGLPWWLTTVTQETCRRHGLIPGSGRSPAEGNGNPLHYSCLENPTDRGAWWATVHEVAKSQTWLSD